MATTSVQYVPKGEDKKYLNGDSRHFPRDVQIGYLKTTIVVLALAFVTVIAILVWQLLTNKQNCRKQEENQSPVNKVPLETQKSNDKTKWQCPPVINKNSLPYDLPASIKNILEDVGNSLKEEVEKKTLVSISSSAFYREQTIWNAGFGVVDKSSLPQQTPDKDTLYRTGSIVKLLTILTTFKLVEDRKIDCLDDPLRKYAAKFSVKNPFNDDIITIREILSHTSGLPREVPCGPSFSSKRDNICPVNTTYVFQEVAKMELKFAPGTSVGYSNLGYAILAHSLFQRFGSSYASWNEWMSHEILIPLGMTNTVLDDQRYVSNIAVSYKDNGEISPALDWGWSSPSFQMSTSTSDLTKLMQALVNPRSSFLQENIIHEMFKPVFVFSDLQTIFTSGWQLHNQNSLRVFSKAGAIPGSSGALFLIPDFRFGFILLTTGQEIAPKLSQEIMKKLTKAFSSSSIGLSLEIKSPAVLTTYIGNYILDNNWSDRVQATISVESFSGLLKLSQEPGYPPFVYLSFIKSNLLQIVYPRGLSCQVYALGQNKEYLKFEQLDSTGRFKIFTLGSFVFKRISR